MHLNQRYQNFLDVFNPQLQLVYAISAIFLFSIAMPSNLLDYVIKTVVVVVKNEVTMDLLKRQLLKMSNVQYVFTVSHIIPQIL